jgi:hypothetical protein
MHIAIQQIHVHEHHLMLLQLLLVTAKPPQRPQRHSISTATCDLLLLLNAGSTIALPVIVQNTGNVELSGALLAVTTASDTLTCACTTLPPIPVGATVIPTCTCPVPQNSPPQTVSAIATVTGAGLAATQSSPVTLTLLRMAVEFDAPTSYASTGELHNVDYHYEANAALLAAHKEVIGCMCHRSKCM